MRLRQAGVERDYRRKWHTPLLLRGLQCCPYAARTATPRRTSIVVGEAQRQKGKGLNMEGPGKGLHLVRANPRADKKLCKNCGCMRHGPCGCTKATGGKQQKGKGDALQEKPQETFAKMRKARE